jgi:hypothetical protein
MRGSAFVYLPQPVADHEVENRFRVLAAVSHQQTFKDFDAMLNYQHAD